LYGFYEYLIGKKQGNFSLVRKRLILDKSECKKEIETETEKINNVRRRVEERTD